MSKEKKLLESQVDTSSNELYSVVLYLKGLQRQTLRAGVAGVKFTADAKYPPLLSLFSHVTDKADGIDLQWSDLLF